MQERTNYPSADMVSSVISLLTGSWTNIDIKPATLYMKPEETPYFLYEALLGEYFCIAELNMIW